MNRKKSNFKNNVFLIQNDIIDNQKKYHHIKLNDLIMVTVKFCEKVSRNYLIKMAQKSL